jgi:hypothetical protein
VFKREADIHVKVLDPFRTDDLTIDDAPRLAREVRDAMVAAYRDLPS